LVKGTSRWTCNAMGLRRKAACSRSISGVTPPCGRLSVGAAEAVLAMDGAGARVTAAGAEVAAGTREAGAEWLRAAAVGETLPAVAGGTRGAAAAGARGAAAVDIREAPAAAVRGDAGVDIREAAAGEARASLTRERAAAPARAGIAGGDDGEVEECDGARSGRIPAKSASARCSLGVITLSAPRASCLMTRASMTIMIAPTMARWPLTARSSTAERESPRSDTSTGGPSPLEKASTASRTALCSSGPMELSLSQSRSPCSSWRDTAWARAGSTAARTFWHTAS